MLNQTQLKPNYAENVQTDAQPVNKPDISRVCSLRSDKTNDVLAFLSRRPVHTVVMSSWIRDNGIVSPHNRGIFYGYCNDLGELEGVALIGHTTLVEAHTEEALEAFAWIAKSSELKLHFLMAAGDTIETFWSYYVGDASKPRLICSELLFEMTFPTIVRKTVEKLRQATAEDLLLVAKAHAQVAFEESGVNPLEKDCEKFLERTLRRIEKGWCWVLIEEGRLLFKADIVAQTLEVSYLEGIYVAPDVRGNGIGPDCLSQLGLILLQETKSVCLLSNVEFEPAHHAYKKAGFRIKDKCQTIFV